MPLPNPKNFALSTAAVDLGLGVDLGLELQNEQKRREEEAKAAKGSLTSFLNTPYGLTAAGAALGLGGMK